MAIINKIKQQKENGIVTTENGGKSDTDPLIGGLHLYTKILNN